MRERIIEQAQRYQPPFNKGHPNEAFNVKIVLGVTPLLSVNTLLSVTPSLSVKFLLSVTPSLSVKFLLSVTPSLSVKLLVQYDTLGQCETFAHCEVF